MSGAPSVLDIIGNTPVVRLHALAEDGAGEVWVKLEAGNPTGSYKDRMAKAMIAGAERAGRLAPGQPVVEYTGGSTGSSLAFVCAVTGHPLYIVTSDAFAEEKRRTMEAFGAIVEIIPSPEGITPELIPRMRARAAELAAELGAYQTDQFRNTDMVDGLPRPRGGARRPDPRTDRRLLFLRRHRRLLPRREPRPARRLPRHRAGGGGAGGVGRCSPAGRRGSTASRAAAPASSRISSTRRDFDDVIAISTADTFAMARRAARTEGIFSGPSTGANLLAALAVARRLGGPRGHDPGRLGSEVPRRRGVRRVRPTRSARSQLLRERSCATPS